MKPSQLVELNRVVQAMMVTRRSTSGSQTASHSHSMESWVLVTVVAVGLTTRTHAGLAQVCLCQVTSLVQFTLYSSVKDGGVCLEPERTAVSEAAEEVSCLLRAGSWTAGNVENAPSQHAFHLPVCRCLVKPASAFSFAVPRWVCVLGWVL